MELAAETIEVRRMWPNGPAAIVPDAPGEPVAYARYSGVDLIADKSFLDQWNAERILDGIAAQPELLNVWKPQALERAARIRYVNSVKRIGGAWTKADRGTKFHDWACKVTSAKCDIADVPDEYRPAVNAYTAALAELELTIVAVERFVVDDDRRLAGTFDAMVRDRNGDHFILDIKTGRLYPIGLAMQLYGYAVAPWYLIQGDALDGTDDQRIAKPACRTDMAYVAEIDIDAGTAKIRAVDLLEAPLLYRLRDEILDAREMPPHIGPVINGARTPLDKVAAMFPGVVDVTDHLDDDRRTWLRDRMQTIIAAGLGDLLADRWPDGVPTLKSGDPIATADGDRLAQLCSELEAEAGLEFPPPAPDQRDLARPAEIVRRRAMSDEGNQLDDTDLVELRAAYAALDDDQRAWVHRIIDDAGKYGRPIRLSGPQGKATERRRAANHALVALAPHLDDELARSVLTLAIGETVQPAHRLGETFGSLTVDEAEKVRRIVAAIDDRRITVGYQNSGVTLAGDLSAALAA